MRGTRWRRLGGALLALKLVASAFAVNDRISYTRDHQQKSRMMFDANNPVVESKPKPVKGLALYSRFERVEVQ